MTTDNEGKIWNAKNENAVCTNKQIREKRMQILELGLQEIEGKEL